MSDTLNIQWGSYTLIFIGYSINNEKLYVLQFSDTMEVLNVISKQLENALCRIHGISRVNSAPILLFSKFEGLKVVDSIDTQSFEKETTILPIQRI